MGGGQTYHYRCGYGLFGPLLFGYTKWLRQTIERVHAEKVLFASRDGFILQKAYNIVDGQLDNAYFYVSRKSIITALLHGNWDLQSSLQRYKSWTRKFSFGFFLAKMGLSIKDIPEVDDYDLKTEFTMDGFLKSEKMQRQFEQVKPLLEKKSIENENLLKLYFQQLQLENKKVVLVDIGGRRTIEKNLREFFQRNGMNIDFYGCYLEAEDKAGSGFDAYLFDEKKNRKLCHETASFYYFLEIILSAPHGSVVGYKKNGQSIDPVFEEYDYISVDAEPGILHDLQEGALEFCRDFLASGFLYELTPELAIRNLKNFGLYPNSKDIEFWKDFRFNMDHLTPVLKSEWNIFTCVKNPKGFIDEYKSTLWKAGMQTQVLGTSRLNGFIVWLKQYRKR